jgi:hypothetical protein
MKLVTVKRNIKKSCWECLESLFLSTSTKAAVCCMLKKKEKRAKKKIKQSYKHTIPTNKQNIIKINK